MKSTAYKQDEVAAERRQPALAALGERIGKVADAFANRKSAAEAAGISTDQLARYLRGENQPGLLAMAALCREHGISLDWLASGEGSMYGQVVNTELLALIVNTVEQALARQALAMTTEKKSRLIALLYSLYEHGNEESIHMDNVVRLIDFGR